jgi:hypothetical protein
MAALNLKNHMEARVENCLFRDNEICFRVRGGKGEYGGANVTIDSCAVFDSRVAIRAEDGVELTVRRLGIGNGVKRLTVLAGGGAAKSLDQLDTFQPPKFDEALAKGFAR